MIPPERRFAAIPDPRPDDLPWREMSWPPAATVLAGDVVALSACVPERDAEPLFEALNDGAVWRHISPVPRDAEELATNLARRASEGRFVWIVRLRRPYRSWPAGAVVGTSSYLDIAPADARLEVGGTAYARPFWASKVNPDTKLQLLAHAFDVLGAGRVQLKTDVRNKRSQEAIARLGARYEGTLRRSMRRADGTVRDSVLFSIVAEEWPGVRDGLRARLAQAESEP
jgi:RimJ/RimL family protein N-acetyltransferase